MVSMHRYQMLWLENAPQLGHEHLWSLHLRRAPGLTACQLSLLRVMLAWDVCIACAPDPRGATVISQDSHWHDDHGSQPLSPSLHRTGRTIEAVSRDKGMVKYECERSSLSEYCFLQ